MSLKGKRALVTGGSRGIGRGIALKLADAGARVAVHYHQNEVAAAETLERVRKHGGDGLTVQADVRRPEEVTRIFEHVERGLGGLDIFVSNARPDLPDFYQGPMAISLEQWDAALDSQAKAFLVGVREASRLMGSGGRIIAVTYAPSARTGSWQPFFAMGAGKAALEASVRYFAVALARRGITVNAVSPGLTDDSVLNTLPKEVQDIARAWHESGWTPMGRLTRPDDVGNAVVLLCSAEASWITGQVIGVDGGSSLMDTLLPLDLQRG